MFTLRRFLNIEYSHQLSVSRHQNLIGMLIIGSAVMIGLTGCGQKGELYLAETNRQASSQTMVNQTASDVLNSTSQPQDAAFATIDDDDYEKDRYLEQKQVFPAVSDDPNDY